MVLESVLPCILDVASSLATVLSGSGFLSCTHELCLPLTSWGEANVCLQGLSACAFSFLSRVLLTWCVTYFNRFAFNILLFFSLCRRSLLSSNPRTKSHMGTLILSGPSGCRNYAVPAALAVTALSSTRAISQRQGPVWWTKNWNSTLYPVQRSVTCLQGALLPIQSFPVLMEPLGPRTAMCALNLGFLAFLGGRWQVQAHDLII